MPTALAQVVDEDDTPIGARSYDAIQEKGLRHRIVRIMVESTSGDILLQQRKQTLTLFPGCWDNSAAGHVDPGEEYLAAAARELAEETGIAGVKLREVKYYKTDGMFGRRILKRWNRLYSVTVARSSELVPQDDEVEGFRWVSKEELTKLVQQHPEQISDGLLEAYEIMYT